MRSSATRPSARPSIAARSTPKANRASRALAAAVRADPGARAQARPPRTAISKRSPGVPTVSSVAAGGAGARGFGGGGGIDDILKEVFGGAARGGRRSQPFEQEDFGGAAAGRDVTGTVAITLPEVLTGTSRRVHLPTGKEIDAKLPAGLADGQTIRLKGQGLPGPGGAAGDALITVTIAEHPLFKRDGLNLRLEVPVTLYEAVLGGKVRVPTLDGAVELAIPRGTNSGRTLRVKGKGLPGKDGAGDLYATIRIMLPESGDTDLEQLMKKWRDEKPYDPRRDMS